MEENIPMINKYLRGKQQKILVIKEAGSSQNNHFTSQSAAEVHDLTSH